MQISGRFTIAIHILTCIEIFKNQYKITSDFLAGSIGTNPVIIRNVLIMLKRAGLVNIEWGTGGATISKLTKDSTFLDIYNAVEPVSHKSLFKFHKNPNPSCTVGKNIHNILDSKLFYIQNSMEEAMKKITLADILNDLYKFIK